MASCKARSGISRRGRKNWITTTVSRPRLAGALHEAEKRFQAEKERLEARHAGRQKRLARALKSSHAQRQQEVTDFEGKQKYQLQRDLLQNDRKLETGLANEEKAYAEFCARIAEAQAAFSQLDYGAQFAFGAYKKFLVPLGSPASAEAKDATTTHEEVLAELHEVTSHTGADLAQFQKLALPSLFRTLPLALQLVLVAAVTGGVFFAARHFNLAWATPAVVIGSGVGLIVLLTALYFVGERQSAPLAAKLAQRILRGRQLSETVVSKAATHHSAELQRIKDFCTDNANRLNEHWAKVVTEAAQLRESFSKNVPERHANALRRNDHLLHKRLQAQKHDHQTEVVRLREDTERKKEEQYGSSTQKVGQLTADYETQRRELLARWQEILKPIYEKLEAHISAAQTTFPEWPSHLASDWKPPAHAISAAKFACIEVDVDKLAEANLAELNLPLPGPSRFTVPLTLTYPYGGSVLFETAHNGDAEAIESLNNIMLRLLSQSPPGRVSLTIIDPVGLGQSFAGIMHLADYGDHLINSRIWTQPQQIEKKLNELSEHMEKVIQMYLRNEYETITEYNEKAGTIAEKYHFLVVSGFPANFTEQAARRLLSIATSGARCGVFTLIHWDQRQPVPHDFLADELRKSSVSLSNKSGAFVFSNLPAAGATLTLDRPPAPDFVTEFIQKVGECNVNSNRIEVPFSHVTPPEAEQWSLETAKELRVPIGRTGATKLQYLAMGQGTRQHALIAGKTGSGKSTLFHVIVTNLALWCSPEQVEFYLVDFKKGVEFKCYATRNLPHARVIAIESDREFGLSVLQRLDEELRRRGELFRKLGVQDVAGYKRMGGTEPIPRSLLLIDEFQELFVEDDRVSQGAALLLDRIVRQGRAFGIHAILGSQSLGGAYTLARTTMGQMVIRIALQCNEADAYLIMDENNPAPRLLTRPGEGIYNDTAGTMEGNSPFQTVWLSDEIRDQYLDKVIALNEKQPSRMPAPIIFEGNEPADVQVNVWLPTLLTAERTAVPTQASIWMGAPNSIKGDTEAVFQRQSGSNLLIVGQRPEATQSILSVALIALAAQYPAGKVRLIVIDSSLPGTPERAYLDATVRALLQTVTVARGNEVDEMMNQLAQDLKQRTEDAEGSEAPDIFVFIQDLQKHKRLRYEEDFNFSSDDSAPASPGKIFDQLITQGPAVGIHLAVFCDTFNNVSRFINRKAMTEFEMRVLFQMSANDSASLIDSAKATNLGLHRALYYSEQSGHLEVFRPYALPPLTWLEKIGGQLAQAGPQEP
ncbi:MAG: segregation ATPase, FtsK/SpoIIIE family [Verrucomicrobia bacterium]|nr:segregation ATPase, FtsK/SpoIIIE family [Verrucomicrobiota bacterium]